MAGAPLRSAPSGDCDRPAWLIGCQDVLLPKPAVRPVRTAKRLGSKKAIDARKSQHSRSDRRSRLDVDASARRWQRRRGFCVVVAAVVTARVCETILMIALVF